MADAEGRITKPALAAKITEIFSPAFAEPGSAAAFIENIGIAAAPGAGYFTGIFMRLQDKALPGGVEEIASGSYGRVYSYVEDASKVIKEQFEINTSDDAAKREAGFRDFFIEIMIQIILSSDNELGHHIPKIFSVWRNGDNMGYTEMERITTVSEYTKFMSGKFLDGTYDFFAHMRSLAVLLQRLNAKYQFVHFDFKPQNVAITDDGVAKIFDFGVSCLQYEGAKIRAQSFLRLPQLDVPCNPAADFGLYFFMIRTYNHSQIKPDAKAFVDMMLSKHSDSVPPKSLLMMTAEKFHNGVHAAYNFEGTRYNELPQFRPENVIVAIDTRPVLAGGRRRRTLRRRRSTSSSSRSGRRRRSYSRRARRGRNP